MVFGLSSKQRLRGDGEVKKFILRLKAMDTVAEQPQVIRLGQDFYDDEPKKGEAMPNWTDSEKQRRVEAEAGRTVVANIRKGADETLVAWAKSQGKYVYIGRSRSGFSWGNPYEIGRTVTGPKYATNILIILTARIYRQKLAA